MSTLNVNTISSTTGNNLVISGSLTVTGNISGSITNALTASYALNGGGSVNTSSLLVTASFSDPNLTFEKGDGSTFNVDISTLIPTNTTSASYVAGANVDGYVNNATEADSVYTTTSGLPPGNYPILLGWPGVFDNFSGVYSKTTLTFNPSTNNLTFSGSLLISGSIIPATNGASTTSSFSLGSPTNGGKDIYVSNGTINFLDGSGTIQGTLSSTANGIATDGDAYFNSVRVGQGPKSGSSNIVVGDLSFSASSNDDRLGNTAIGSNTLVSYIGGPSGLNSYNTALGSYSLENLTSGGHNTAVGHSSLKNASTGIQNTAVGYHSLSSVTSGTNNIGVGTNAMNANTTGFQNVAIGDNTFEHLTAGNDNVAVGFLAGRNASANSTGNVYLGIKAGPSSQVNQSNKLYINNDYGDPLIGGDFSSRKVIISGSFSSGQENSVLGSYSHAEGRITQAVGDYSHAEGSGTQAVGDYSHAEGLGTIASGSYQHVQGQFNTQGDDTSLMIVGNGTGQLARSDAFKVRMSGSIVLPTTQSAAPSWTGTDGEIVPATVGGQYFLYMWMNGAWRSGSFV